MKKQIRIALIVIIVVLLSLVLLHLTMNVFIPQIAAMHSGMF